VLLPFIDCGRGLRLTGVVSMDPYIYVVGGYDGDVQLASVERYNVDTCQWEMITSMVS
jgi:hypothetical protein